MSPYSRHLIWFAAGAALGLTGLVAIAGVAAGEYEEGFWRTVAALVIVLTSACAALAGAELIERRQLVVLGWWVALTAPVEAVALLFANWQEHVGEEYADGLITATAFLLTGLVVSTLRLLVRERSPLVLALFAAAALVAAAIDVLAVVLTWSTQAPDAALSALLALIVVTLLLYALTPLAQHLTRPR